MNSEIISIDETVFYDLDSPILRAKKFNFSCKKDILEATLPVIKSNSKIEKQTIPSSSPHKQSMIKN